MKLKSMSSCQCNLVYMQCVGELILEQIKKGPSSLVLAFPKFINSIFYGQSIMILWFIEKNPTFCIKKFIRTPLSLFSCLINNAYCVPEYMIVTHLPNDPQP